MKRERKTGKLRRVIIVILFLVSAGMLLYPTLSTMWNQWRSRHLISDYHAVVGGADPAVYERIWAEAKEYNDQHAANTIVDAFDEDNEYVLTHPYDTLLDPGGNGVMGYIEIPKIDQELVIYHGTGQEALEDGVGHVEGTSLPIGGPGTHSVLAGHRGLRSAKLFTDLDQMQEGDLFFLHIMDQVLAYKVDQIKTVLPSDAGDLMIEENRDYCTLLTCTPYGVNSHRLLVRGERTEYTEDMKQDETAKKDYFRLMDVSLIAFVFAAIIFIITILLLRKKKKRDDSA